MLHTVHIVNAAYDYSWWRPVEETREGRAIIAKALSKAIRRQLDTIADEAAERYYGETK